MAEAFAIVGLASAIVAFIETGTRVVQRLKQVKDSGTVFIEVADQLPLLLKVVEELQGDLNEPSMDPIVSLALSRTVEGCLRQANILNALLEKSTFGFHDSKLQRFRKTLGGVRNESKVREIQRILETYKTTLMMHLGQSTNKGISFKTKLKPQELCHMPSNRVSYFVGREELLAKIGLNLLPATKELCERRIVVLQGMGGQGKSQVALEYCRRAQACRDFPTIIWIDATSPRTVTNDLEHIAEILIGDSRTFPDSEARLSYAKARLESWPGTWLLVFDNFDQPGAFHNIQDYVPNGHKGALLFTSRHADSSRLGTTIPVEGMSEEESLELLLHQCNLEKTDETAKEGRTIVRELGCLPLAIDQAGSYIRSRRIPLQVFPGHYKSRKAFVLSHTPQLWEYQRRLGEEEHKSSLSVFTTWELSYEQIGNDDEHRSQIGHVLTLSAFFDSTDVSEDIYQSILTSNTSLPAWTGGLITDGRWDKHKFQDVTADLLANSLIQSISFEGEKLSFSLHPLVREWIRLRLNEEDKKQYTIEAIMGLTTMIEHSSKAGLYTSLKYDNIISQLDASMENTQMFLKGDTQLGQGSLTNAGLWFASCYNFHGRYGNAAAVLTRVMEGQTKELGAEHPETSRTVMNLANVYRNLGEYPMAEALYERVLEGRQKLLEPGHLDTLRAMQGLAAIKASQGDAEEAEKILKPVLEGREKILEPDDPETLSVVEPLADAYRHQGRFDLAEAFYGRALERRTRALGTNHPDTARCAEGLAIVYRAQSRHREAIILYERVLKDRQNAFGFEHPSSLQTAMNLAIPLVYMSSYEAAEKLTKSAYEGYLSCLGPRHPSTHRAAQLHDDIHTISKSRHKKVLFHHGMQTASFFELEELPTAKPHVQTNFASLNHFDLPPAKHYTSDRREFGGHNQSHDIMLDSLEVVKQTTSAAITRVKPSGILTEMEPLAAAPQADAEGSNKIQNIASGRDYYGSNKRNTKDFNQIAVYSACGTDFKVVLDILEELYGLPADLPNEQGQTQLSRAAKCGHMDVVQLLLSRNGVNPAAKDTSGFTPLMHAAYGGHEQVMNLLLRRSDVNVNSEDDCQRTALHHALWQKHEAVAKLLINASGVDINSKSKSGCTPLWMAAENGMTEIVKLLLKMNNIDVNVRGEFGETPLNVASDRGHAAVVALLLQADGILINTTCDFGRSPLHRAASRGHEKVVTMLLDTGALDVNSADKLGSTPFSSAIAGHNTAVAQLLLYCKAQYDLKDKEGKTPLAIASAFGSIAGVSLLLRRNDIDLNSMDNEGRTPLFRALNNGHEDVLKLLLEAGARPIVAGMDELERPKWVTEAKRNRMLQMIEDARKLSIEKTGTGFPN